MTLTNKILLILLALTVVCALGFVIYKSHQLTVQQDAINKSITEMKQLQDNIARSQSQYVSKEDLNAFAKQNQINLDAITKDLETLNATVTGINKISVNSSGTSQNNLPSSSTKPNQNPTQTPTVSCNGKEIPCPNADPFGYDKNQQNFDLTENFASNKVPIGSVGFSAWQQNPWNVNIYPRSYNITNVLGTDENGRHYVYNNFNINTNGKNYPVKISDAKFVEEYPSPKFSFFNPRLFAGGDVEINISHAPLKGEITPGVHLGIMSYGQGKLSPDWSFVQVGIGYGTISRYTQVQISPAQYNIGKNIPFMSNTYIGPTLGIGFDGNINVGGGVRVGL